MRTDKNNGYYSGNDELMDRLNNDYSKFSDDRLVREYEFKMEIIDASRTADPFNIFLKGYGLKT